MSEERLSFQAEVSRLLDIVTRSLYSQKEVFLRELISNASDACDKLRYAGVTRPELLEDSGGGFRVRLIPDADTRTLTVADNGIGMNRQDLVDNLGTIARSGTLDFLQGLSGDARKDMALIGQFGVGFYSAFIVADTVEVVTRKAGEAQGWRWTSDGKGEFTIAEAADAPRGTRVILHLSAEEGEFLEEARLRHIVKTYSDHIPIPVELVKTGADGQEEAEQLNRAAALWTRPRGEIGEQEYKEFYHHVGHGFDDPWLTVHYRAEGLLEYTGLLFVPSFPPFDLYAPERAHRLKLYVRRVFVADGAEGLLPGYLRFLRGVVDSEDLPLNVSREMLQGNPMVTKMRHGLTKRVLQDLARKAEDDPAGYAGTFWKSFGPVLKEGLYEDRDNRETLLKLLRARTSESAGEAIDIATYVGRMKDGQDAIYYIAGDDPDALLASPQLEGFRAKGVEVLLLTDPVDEFWVPDIASIEGKPLKSVTRGGTDLSKVKAAADDAPEESAEAGAGTDALIAALKLTLKDAVKDVRRSERLKDSPVCLVADEGDMDMHLERLLRKHKQIGEAARRVLEINPAHPLIQRLAAQAESAGAGGLEDAAWLLLDQARILEGESLPDPAAFSRRLSQALTRALG